MILEILCVLSLFCSISDTVPCEQCGFTPDYCTEVLEAVESRFRGDSDSELAGAFITRTLTPLMTKAWKQYDESHLRVTLRTKFVGLENMTVMLDPPLNHENLASLRVREGLEKFGLSAMAPIHKPNLAEVAGGHIYGHFLGLALHLSGKVPDLKERIAYSAQHDQYGMLHSLLSTHVSSIGGGLLLPERTRLIEKSLKEVFYALCADFKRAIPIFRVDALENFAHGVAHGLTLVYQGHGVEQRTPGQQEKTCLAFEDELLRHNCMFGVYHTFSHTNPEHFFDWDEGGLHFTPRICSDATYSLAMCFWERFNSQANLVGIKIGIQEHQTLCANIAKNDHRLACVLTMVMRNRKDASRNPCEGLADKDEMKSCWFGVIADKPFPSLCPWMPADVGCAEAVQACTGLSKINCVFVLFNALVSDKPPLDAAAQFPWLPRRSK